MNNRHLAFSILEFKEIVNTARENFGDLDRVLKSFRTNQLIDDPEKWGGYEFKTRIGAYLANNIFKQPALERKINDLFVKSVATWLPLIEMFNSKVTHATEGLETTSDFDKIKASLLSLTNANRPEQDANLLIVYLAQFDSVFHFVNSWNKLDITVKQRIVSHCHDKLGFKEAEVDTLFSFPIQHITRLQLHLKSMATILDQHQNDVELTMMAKRFRETSLSIGAKIEEFNSQVPEANKSPALPAVTQEDDLEGSFVKFF